MLYRKTCLTLIIKRLEATWRAQGIKTDRWMVMGREIPFGVAEGSGSLY